MGVGKLAPRQIQGEVGQHFTRIFIAGESIFFVLSVKNFTDRLSMFDAWQVKNRMDWSRYFAACGGGALTSSSME